MTDLDNEVWINRWHKVSDITPPVGRSVWVADEGFPCQILGLGMLMIDDEGREYWARPEFHIRINTPTYWHVKIPPVHPEFKQEQPGLTFEEFRQQVKAKFPDLTCVRMIREETGDVYITEGEEIGYSPYAGDWSYTADKSSVGVGKTLEQAIANVPLVSDMF